MTKLNNKALLARNARELSLQLLFQIFARPEETKDEIINMFLTEFSQNDAILEIALKIVDGVLGNRDALEDLLIENLVGWRPERIGIIDKATIFIALYEIIYKEEKTPVAVAIDEAVELAKRFASPESGRFVNGVLGNIVRSSLVS